MREEQRNTHIICTIPAIQFNIQLLLASVYPVHSGIVTLGVANEPERVKSICNISS